MSDETTPPTRSKAKDFWQLHVPLVVVLALCAFATQIGRAHV